MVGAAAKFGAAVAAVSGVAGASVAAQSVAVGLVVVVFLRCLLNVRLGLVQGLFVLESLLFLIL